MKTPRRVIIASSHPLFGQGLSSLLRERHGENVQVVGMVTSLDEAVNAIDRLNPNLVIVDYDDQVLNREEFLARFVEGEKKLRVVLLSLQSGGEALVYDRRTQAASQIDDWFEEWPYTEKKKRNTARPLNWASSNQANRRENMKHFIAATVLIVVLTVLIVLGMSQANLLPEAASAQAEPIDRLFTLQFNVIYFLFSLIVGLMIYSIVFFRRKRGDKTDARHIEGNTRLEIIWTAIPLVMVIALAFMGSQALAETPILPVNPPPGPFPREQGILFTRSPSFSFLGSSLEREKGYA